MLWIVIGCIFAGAVHDYMCGMLSVRNSGASMPYLTGKYLGIIPKHFINLLAVVLLVLVGVVFVASPAQLLSSITIDIFGTAATGTISVDNAESMAAVTGIKQYRLWYDQRNHYRCLDSHYFYLLYYRHLYYPLIKSSDASILFLVGFYYSCRLA